MLSLTKTFACLLIGLSLSGKLFAAVGSNFISTILVAEWRMDEKQWNGTSDEIKDSSGNNYHGVASSATTTNGFLCNAADLSATGTSDYLTLNHNAFNNLNDFSFSFWLNTSSGSRQTIISAASNSTSNEAVMYFYDEETFRPTINRSGFDSSSVITSEIDTGTWRHFVWTREVRSTDGRSCLYIDNIFQGCVTHPEGEFPIEVVTNGFVIGQEQDFVGGGFASNQALSGLLDEMLLFDHLLTPAEISNIYNNQSAGNGWDGSPRSCPLNLIGEWRFDELFWNGTNNEVLDSSGNDLHLTAFSALTENASPAIPGDPGTCSYGIFNGSISFIQLDDDTSTSDSLLDIPDNLTITTWINTNVIPSSGLKSIISKDENYEFHINTSGEIFWWWRWATLTTNGANITPGRWHHIAVTWRNGEQVIYVDGTERARSSRFGTLDINNDPLQVGQDLDIASRFFDGSIDEVRIYEEFLNHSQINQIMNETRPCSSSGICSTSFVDDFNAASYSNSNGSAPWASDWIELGDDTSPTNGDIRITGGELRIDNSQGNYPSIARELDLSSYISAFIQISTDTSNNLEGNDRITFEASSNGGLSYTELDTIQNDQNSIFSYDLTPYRASNTRIRIRVNNGFTGSSEYIYFDRIAIIGQKNCGPDHFRVVHDGNGINCYPENITIRVEDAANILVSDYQGTINISTTTGNGDWGAGSANGTLVNSGSDTGAASYTFALADSGSATLTLSDTHAESLNIAVSDGATVDENTEGDLIFRPFGFLATPSPAGTQVAGRPFDISLTAAGQIPTDPECGVIEEYTGAKTVNFWGQYTSPTSSSTAINVNGNDIATSEAASSGQNITFSNGVATFPVRYDDAGVINIHAKDISGIGEPSGTGDEIMQGGVSPFVVRPFAYDIQVENNPNATGGNSPAYRTAGQTFNMTLRSVLWESSDDTNNDGVPDDFSQLSNNGITPNISSISQVINLSPTAQIVTNSNGILTATNATTTNFSAAASQTFLQSWSEVGILQIDALTSSFMNGGQDVQGQRRNTGRFIPDNYLLTITDIIPQCDSFTYAGFNDGTAALNRNGQMFSIAGNIIARNLNNVRTQNYAADFVKLSNTNLIAQPYNVTASSSANGQLNFSPAPLSFTGGESPFTAANSDFQFAAIDSNFNLRVDLTATDSDSVSSGQVSSNSVDTRLGRLRLIDAYGPETSALEVRLISEFYDGSHWVTNQPDICTHYIQTDFSFETGSYTDNLSPGETAIFSPTSIQRLVNGVSTISNGAWFSAPGVNNYGSVKINIDLSSQDWLGFDWNGDSVLDPTTGTLNFGYYRGSDRVIFWRERRN